MLLINQLVETRHALSLQTLDIIVLIFYLGGLSPDTISSLVDPPLVPLAKGDDIILTIDRRVKTPETISPPSEGGVRGG